jgi:hypothetical protein
MGGLGWLVLGKWAHLVAVGLIATRWQEAKGVK